MRSEVSHSFCDNSKKNLVAVLKNATVPSVEVSLVYKRS